MLCAAMLGHVAPVRRAAGDGRGRGVGGGGVAAEIAYIASFSWEGVGSGNLFQNMILGGVDEHGRRGDNALSLLVLQAAINCRTIQPTLSVWSAPARASPPGPPYTRTSLKVSCADCHSPRSRGAAQHSPPRCLVSSRSPRYDGSLSDEFLLKAAECVKTGVGFPAFFNMKVRTLTARGRAARGGSGWRTRGATATRVPSWPFPGRVGLAGSRSGLMGTRGYRRLRRRPWNTRSISFRKPSHQG